MTLLGRQIGRYKILEQLGSGGMSVVYKGLDTALDREVAVKVLETPGGPRVKAEYEDVRQAARRMGRPALEVAREAEHAARALVTSTTRGRE